MRLYLIILSSFILMQCTGSCSDSAARIDHNITDAETAFVAGRIDRAQSLCDAIDADATSEKMNVTQLGRLSLLHMKLNESTAGDETDNVGRAVACYRAAFERNADSARVYYTDCPTDDVPYVITLSTLVKSIDNPTPWPEEEPDSIP